MERTTLTMKLSGKPTFRNSNGCVLLEIPIHKAFRLHCSEFCAEAEELDLEKEYTLEIAKIKRKRTLDSNAYYHSLKRRIAKEMGISESEYHNRVLAEVGIADLDAEGNKIWSLFEDAKFDWLKQLEGQDHWHPSSNTYEVGNTHTIFRAYWKLKSTSQMDTKEFNQLLDYIIQDANELGIESRTPDQVRRDNRWETT